MSKDIQLWLTKEQTLALKSLTKQAIAYYREYNEVQRENMLFELNIKLEKTLKKAEDNE